MRAVRHTTNGIEVLDVDPPHGDGVLVHIRAVGICGTDLSLLKRGPLPVTLGHEMAGDLDDGTPVAIEPVVTCGTCDQCKGGNYHRCRLGLRIGIGIARDGGMAEMIRVPERCLTRLPAGVQMRDAALVEPLAVILHGLRRSEVSPGQRVAVVGGGSVGLLAVAATARLGCEVGLVARYEHQIERGKKLGAVEAKGEYNVVLECAGTESALAQACALAAPAGTVVVYGAHFDKLVLPGMAVLGKELRILPSLMYNQHGGGSDFDSAAAFLARNPDIAEVLITHRFSLEQARKAFETALDRKSGAIKVALHPA
jgi:threonine dehydrogenase-like Zn-dependent dehydrogenase